MPGENQRTGGDLKSREQKESKMPQLPAPNEEGATGKMYSVFFDGSRPKMEFVWGVAGCSLQIALVVEGDKVYFGLDTNHPNEGEEFYDKIFDESEEEATDFIEKLKKEATTKCWKVVGVDDDMLKGGGPNSHKAGSVEVIIKKKKD